MGLEAAFWLLDSEDGAPVPNTTQRRLKIGKQLLIELKTVELRMVSVGASMGD
jgi:hypothetical protein